MSAARCAICLYSTYHRQGEKYKICYFVFLQTLTFKSFESSCLHNDHHLRAAGIYNSLSSGGLAYSTLSAMQNHLWHCFSRQLHKRLWPWSIADGTVPSPRRKALQTNSHKGRAVCAAAPGTEHLSILPEVKQTRFTRKGDQILRYNWDLLK